MNDVEVLSRRLRRTAKVLIRLLDAIEKYNMQIENDPYLYLAFHSGQKIAIEVALWQLKAAK